MIPKIIHQTGPNNKAQWHPLWEKCSESWKAQFSDWEYRFWNDDEIDELVESKFPQYFEMYKNFPVHIMRIDFVRSCLMYEFGGIYADLDYYCYKNFENHLEDQCAYLVENPYGNDPIENSLMASSANHPFWIEFMDSTQNKWNEIKNKKSELIENMSIISTDPKYGKILRPYLVFYVSGTNNLSSTYKLSKYRNSIITLPGWYFNNSDISYDESYIARHIHTGLWGKENIAINESNGADITLRNIPIDQFDFFRDYSNGRYKNYVGLDWDKNDVSPLPNLTMGFQYQ